MTDLSSVRRLLATAAAGLLVAALPAGLLAPGAVAANTDLPTVMALPDNWLPEGIATVGSTAYLGSRADGDLLSLDLTTGEWIVFSQGPGTPSVGLKARDGLLWVAGGGSGTGRVVDIATGDIVETFAFTPNTSFVNDVVLTDAAAWFTDSAQAQLYRVSLADWSVTTLPLSGEWVQGTSTSANGISTTPDGAALLVINSFNGTLYRVDPGTGEATAVDADVPLTNGDGLLRQGRTLYVVQNRLNTIAVLRLSSDGTSAELTDTITAPSCQDVAAAEACFDVPTTVARWGQGLYLPNAKFGANPPATEFEVVRVSVP
jgi:sugar lactone lactonase YvrE